MNSHSYTFAQICQDGDKEAAEANAEEVHDENEAQDAPACCVSQEEPTNEKYMWSYQQQGGK